MLKRVKRLLISRDGISLLETLIALTILTVIVFSFTPLFAQYFKSIKTAGNIQKQTQYKTSIMERLIAYRGSNKYYETAVMDVPIQLTGTGNTVSFNSNTFNHINGTAVYTDYIAGNGSNSYATFIANAADAKMVCFPNELTDDFIETEIVVVAKGFKFDKVAFPNDNRDYGKQKSGYQNSLHFELFYTDSTGSVQKMPTSMYELRREYDGDELIAIFKLYGGNDVICFEKSPLYIEYGTGTGRLQYSVKVEIGAPEIIMVGEQAKDGKYYYYATSGLKEDGSMDIIAKEMKDAPLTSAMNDVEWVEKGMGDDGNGGVNKYGYYIMGGDAGQVRRFWQNTNTGNYYWGGDDVVLYSRNYDLNANGGSVSPNADAWEGSYEFDTEGNLVFKSNQLEFVRTTEATSSTIFRTTGDKSRITIYKNNGSSVTQGSSFYYIKKGVWHFGLCTFAYSTVSDDKQRNDKSLENCRVMYVNNGSSASQSWSETTGLNKLNVDGYKAATGYQYDNTVTITSVGAIKINSGGPYQFATATSPLISSNIYPTQSYTLYCGYIPAVINIFGQYCGAEHVLQIKKDNVWTYQATLGIANIDGDWYPIGNFGDIHAKSDLFLGASKTRNLSYRNLLNWEGSQTALASQGNDYYITNGEEVAVTIGYTSHPYAMTVLNTQSASDLQVSGNRGSDYFFPNNDCILGVDYTGSHTDANGNSYVSNARFDHSFIGRGLRDFSTMLDVKSWYDDANDICFSIAVGYSLVVNGNDYNKYTRLAQVYNSGLVFIRAAGGDDYEDSASMASGTGWSLGKETNAFHEFYSTYQYQDGPKKSGINNLAFVYAARGWDTRYHKAYHNISIADGEAPKLRYSPSPDKMKNGYEIGKNTHPMEFCKCTTVNKGLTWDENTQIMWGTDNGTLLSWTLDNSPTGKSNSKITAVTKEFENYTWINAWGPTTGSLETNSYLINYYEKTISSVKNEFYDYPSVSAGKSENYGFISSLKSINDVAYADGYWVAVGEQGYIGDGTNSSAHTHINPANYCGVNGYYRPTGLSAGTGSYINVKYDTGEKEDSSGNPFYAWRAVKVSDNENINFISVTYSRGVWYAMGYQDANHNGENENGNCVIFYSTDPSKQWKQASTTAIRYDSVEGKVPVELNGINSMASRGN